MFKKLAIGISCIILAATAAALAGCGGVKDYDKEYADKVKVVYMLEGGYYGDATRVPEKVNQYYDYVDGLKIKAPGKTVDRDGYDFIDWYTGTVDEDGELHYDEDPWDFNTDTVPREGITLYAKWKEMSKYGYKFVYIDEKGEKQALNRLSVEADQKYGECYPNTVIIKKVRHEIEGKTAVGIYYDKEFTKEFDDSVVPEKTFENGEEVGKDVELYVKFLEGEYTVVTTAQELKNALDEVDEHGRDITVDKIYVFNDIDMKQNNGKPFNFCDGNRGLSNRTLLSNGKKIYNFTLKYSDKNDARREDFESGRNTALHISLFGNVTNATVKGVTFEDITVTVATDNRMVTKIYVAPLAVSATNCTFENVTVKAAYGYGKLPNSFGTDFTFDAERGMYVNETSNLIFVAGNGVYKNEKSAQTDCNYTGVTLSVKTEE